MPRTDFTQEIDGAFASRNVGSRHWSDVARSGNGNMRRDLRPENADYEELTGVDERTEAGSIQPAPGRAAIGFRYPKAGEKPPMNAKPGKTWLRKLTPAGTGVVRAVWVQVSKARLLTLQRAGQLKSGGLSGLGEIGTGTILSLGAGLVGGFAVWYFLLRKKS